MLRNYILVAFRTLRRQRLFSAINILGLAISAAACLVLILFLIDRATLDTFHEYSDRLYRATSTYKSRFNADAHDYATSPASLADLARREVPGVDVAVSLVEALRGSVERGEERLPISGYLAGPEFFDLFRFELAAGDPETALAEPFSLVVTPSEAVRLTGSANALGQELVIDGNAWTITGVFDRDAWPSHVPLELVGSAATMSALAFPVNINEWFNSIYVSYTYLRLEEGARRADVEKAVNGLRAPHFPDVGEDRLDYLTLQPVVGIDLGADLDNQLGPVLGREQARLLGVLALIVLLASCFNYAGLTVARALGRAREIGVRKVFGADRRRLKVQFFLETAVITSLAVVLALVLLGWMLPAFNALQFVQALDTQVAVDWADPRLYLVLTLFIAAVSLLAGVYPAAHLARFEPRRALMGRAGLSAGGGQWLRRSLVGLQLGISTLFVLVGSVIYAQTGHLRSADYGFSHDDVIAVPISGVPWERYAESTASVPGVDGLAGTMILPATGSRSDTFISSDAEPEERRAYWHAVTGSFFETLDVPLVAGRYLDDERLADTSSVAVVNEALIAQLGLGSAQEAIGRRFKMEETQIEIVGVTPDVHLDVMVMDVFPMIYQREPEILRWALIRTTPGATDRVLAGLEGAWSQLATGRPFEHALLSDRIADNFVNRDIQDLLRVVGLVSVLALVIAVLGVVGVAAQNAERRLREVSIRRVLGASSRDVVSLLGREFVVLGAGALVVAVPASIWLARAFLSDYSSRVALSPGLFAPGIAVVALLVAGIVVLFGIATTRQRVAAHLQSSE